MALIMSRPGGENPETDLRERPALRWLFIAVLLLLCSLQVGKSLIWLPAHAFAVDYPKHYYGPLHLKRGVNPFQFTHQWLEEGPRQETEAYQWVYPIFTAVIYLWLTATDVETAAGWWKISCAVWILLCAVVVALYYRPEEPLADQGDEARSVVALRKFLVRHWWIVGPFLTLHFMPPIKRLFDGNLEPTSMLLLTLFGAAWLRQRDFLAGVALTAATLVKILPALLIVVFIAGRRWRVVAGMTSSLIFYWLLLAVLGWFAWEWNFYFHIMPNFAFLWPDISESLAYILARVFNPRVFEDVVALKRWCMLVNLIVVLPFTLGVLLSCRRRLGQWMELAIAFVALSLPLLTPLLEYHHFAFIFISWIFMIRLWLAGRVSLLFYLQLPFWLYLNATGFIDDVKLINDWVNPYVLATLANVALWLIAGIALIRLGGQRLGDSNGD